MLLLRAAVFTAWLAGSLLLYLHFRRKCAHPKSVCVLVLGDLGRSPRMMYHAQSLLSHGFVVYLVGYTGTPVLEALSSHPNLVIVHVAQPPKWIANLPRILFILVAPFKLVFGALSLFWALTVQLPTFPRALLVQTPPALPTLPLVQLATWLQGSKLIIDWHNTAFSILAMRLGSNSRLTKIAEKLEATFGRKAYAHLFVTEAMKAKLSTDWKLYGQKLTFHDRPQSTSSRLSASEAHALFSRLCVLRDPALSVLAPAYEGHSTSTLFTQSTSFSSAEWREDRPALLVSSTSWTADEDFSILLEAMDTYEANVENGKLPKLVVLITGKGAGKEAFVRQVKEKERMWKYVRCRTVWLEQEDYPKLLGAADLGVSLHTSSSGLDLPMKVVDMFGAGLPVLALDFPCISELVKDGINGQIFHDAASLDEQMQSLLGHREDLARLREGVQVNSTQKWDAQWQASVLPIVDACCRPPTTGTKKTD